MQTFPRMKLGLLFFSALLVALLLTSSVAPGHEVADGDLMETKKAERSPDGGSYDHLKMLTISDLKKLIFDKTGGRVHFTNKETKDDLITLVKEIEAEEQSEDDFRYRVLAAMAKRNATIEAFQAGKKFELKEPSKQKQNGGSYMVDDQLTAVNSVNAKEVNAAGPHSKIRLPHRVVIQYCIGCGYAKHFENVKKNLEVNLPNIQDVHISGFNYPIPFLRLLIGKVCTIMFFMSFVMGSVGQHFRVLLPTRMHEYIVQKRALIIGLGILLNLLGNSLMQNGAFEVYINDELVYSKLLKGVAPSPQDVYKLILEKTLLRDYT